MIWIIANVTFASIVGSNLCGCWRFHITLGFIILVLAWGLAQVGMFEMRRRRVAVLETTFVVRVILICASLFTRGSSAMLAKRDFSFILFIIGLFFVGSSTRFLFEIGSVCSLSFLSELSVLFFFLSEGDDL